ncbi:hypothetical protein GCM10017668_03080 [Streptomyces tuirus]|uniref:Uncharacterized protein n=1 Tax=Streptomyces tuirus TaxID=68278 RepID=A0A7G1NB90_9ACTN|nr:hypothetical protein GCM10017668_03080 [Streptomyces tuirus]
MLELVEAGCDLVVAFGRDAPRLPDDPLPDDPAVLPQGVTGTHQNVGPCGRRGSRPFRRGPDGAGARPFDIRGTGHAHPRQWLAGGRFDLWAEQALPDV